MVHPAERGSKLRTCPKSNDYIQLLNDVSYFSEADLSVPFC